MHQRQSEVTSELNDEVERNNFIVLFPQKKIRKNIRNTFSSLQNLLHRQQKTQNKLVQFPSINQILQY